MVSRSKLNKEANDKIQKLVDTYGDMIVRLGITHLINLGTNTVTELSKEDIEQAYQKEIEKQNNLPENVISIMTPECMRDINLIAKELSTLNIWDVLKYIQNDVSIG